jgi:hypothetical protein
MSELLLLVIVALMIATTVIGTVAWLRRHRAEHVGGIRLMPKSTAVQPSHRGRLHKRTDNSGSGYSSGSLMTAGSSSSS